MTNNIKKYLLKTKHNEIFFLLVTGALLNAQLLFSQAVFRTINFPANTGMINVKTQYGAVGDGITDDTDELRAAIGANVTSNGGVYGRKTLYFPPGTYLISQQIDFKNLLGAWGALITLQGAGADSSIIKLTDGAVGFNDTANPKPLLRMAAIQDIGSCSIDTATGGGNCAFRNYVFDLGINTGSNNPGAVGFDYVASNNGAFMYVKIVSGDGQGKCGLALTRDVGPCLIKNVSITGFDCGIYVAKAIYGITFENISLSNQNIVGMINKDNCVFMRKVASNNSVPFLETRELSTTTLLDAILTGTNPAVSAINILPNTPISSTQPVLFARNITTTGYLSAINNIGTVVSGNNVTEYVSHPVTSLFSSPQQSLGLPILETPEFEDLDTLNWANVMDYGAIPNDTIDDAAAIQAAIDAGKPIVYFPLGAYGVATTVIVRGNVQRIIGFNSNIVSLVNPAISIDTITNPFVIIERINVNSIRQASTSAVVFKFGGTGGFTNTASGNIFLEDYNPAGVLTFTNLNLWARQLNLEDTNADTLFKNNGGNFWILGLKTETIRAIGKTSNGGNTELLGGIILASGNGIPDTTATMFTIQDACMTGTFTEISWNAILNFKTYINETRAATTLTLPRSAVVARGYGGIMPLYVGCPIPTSVDPIISLTGNGTVYPNPFSTQTTLQTDNFFYNATLTMENVFGQTVKQINNISGQTVTLLRDNLPSGLYFVRLTQDSKIITTKKLLITD